MKPPGPDDEVVKLLPPLVLTDESLAKGLDIMEDAFATIAAGMEKTAA